MLRFLIVVAAVLISVVTFADENVHTVTLPERPQDFHLFVLAGQSNMAGRGKVEDVDRKPHPRVLTVNKNGEWIPAMDPLHFDKPKIVGVGLGRTFAIKYAEANPGVVVGLIPCAVGGSSIDVWRPKGFHKSTGIHPWDECAARVKKALTVGTLKGILWHQGESDSNPAKADAYEGRLHELIQRMRTEFEAPDVPFIAGQLGQFAERPWNEHRHTVNKAHQQLPLKMKNTAFVKSDGLQHKGDRTHFNSAAYRELGRRYFNAFQALNNDPDGDR